MCRNHDLHPGRNCSQAAHVHAAHGRVGREPQQIAPRQRGQENEREADDDAVPPEYGWVGRDQIDSLATEPGAAKLPRYTGVNLLGLLTNLPTLGAFALNGSIPALAIVSSALSRAYRVASPVDAQRWGVT
jgi:hypothetical protein